VVAFLDFNFAHSCFIDPFRNPLGLREFARVA
jgi:hypothetical protein